MKSLLERRVEISTKSNQKTAVLQVFIALKAAASQKYKKDG